MWKISMPEAGQMYVIICMKEAKALFVTQLTTYMMKKIGVSEDGLLSPRYVDVCGASDGKRSVEGPNKVFNGFCEPHNFSPSYLHPDCFDLARPLLIRFCS